MDHIPNIPNPHKLILVPYLGGSYGNNECFSSCLSQKKIEMEALQARPLADSLQMGHEAKTI